MAKVYSPNKKYTGVSASVRFLEGVGETDNAYLIEWFKSHGYKVEGDSKDEISKMTIDELKEFAIENKIDIGDSTLKKDILTKIADAISAKTKKD